MLEFTGGRPHDRRLQGGGRQAAGGDHAARAAVSRAVAPRRGCRPLRPGQVDRQTAHPERRCALRLQEEPLPRAAPRTLVAAAAEPRHHDPEDRSALVEGSDAEDGCGLRPVRQLEDRAEGDAEQVSERTTGRRSWRSCRRSGAADDAKLERRERELHSGLRPDEPGGQRRVRRDGESELRQGRRRDRLRSDDAARLGRARIQLGVHDQRAARARAARVRRRRLLPPLVRQPRARRPATAAASTSSPPTIAR